jgi:uncharacterized membrane protein YjgN (DUF898 family)
VSTTPIQDSRQTSIQFNGEAAEYFRVWIVNICLTIVTLGIYSAWAKVRRKRYFYGNTLLNGSSFDYLANPKAILKGRVIVFVAFVLYSITKEINPLIAPVLLLILFFFLPAIVIRALRFNAINSVYRNVRFGFDGRHGEALRLLLLVTFLMPLTLGLIFPYYVFRKKKFFIEHSSYGKTPFAFSATVGGYYVVYLTALLYFLLFLVGSVVTLGIGALPLYILFAAYRDGAVGRLTWANTSLGDIRFACRWKTGALFKLYFLNTLGVVLTLGLLAPWAAIRMARYQVGGLSIEGGNLDSFLANATQQVGATGEEADDFLGFEFGL